MSGEINSCEDLCAFIRANEDHPGLIEMALSNPEVLEKIKDLDHLKEVLLALQYADALGLISLVFRPEILIKISVEDMCAFIRANPLCQDSCRL
jgi:hypothetical protein